MTLFDLNELSLFLAQAAAPATGAENPGPPLLLNLLMWGSLFGLIYFLFFRPISKARKEQENMAATVKPGAKVITVGGIVGYVTSVKDKTVLIRSGDGTKLEILKEKLASVENSGKESKDEKAKDTSANEEASDEAEEVDVEVTDEDGPSNSSGNPYNRSRRRRKGARR